MSHHYSGPDYGFPHGDARLDLTDLYVFPKPEDAGKSIVIMNVHPSAGVNPAGATTAEPFSTVAIYEFKIDTNGDAVADIAYRVRFSATANGQSASVRRVEGEQAANTGESGQIVLDGAPVSTGLDAHVTEAGDYRFFAGWRSEPFFFDTQGALNNLQFTGDDFFANGDVCSVAEESGPTAINVLANDVGNNLVVSSIPVAPAYGTVIITSGGTGLTYQPDANILQFLGLFDNWKPSLRA